MPNDAFKSIPKKKKLAVTPTDLSPEQLGDYLRHRYDVVILGERHDSQKLLDCNAEIFRHLRASVLCEETGISSTFTAKDLANPIISNWGKKVTAVEDALRLRIPVQSVDIDHCRSEQMVEQGTRIARELKGEKGAFIKAVEYALKEAKLNKHKIDDLKPLRTEHLRDDVERFLGDLGSSVSDMNKDNVRHTLNDHLRSMRPDIISKISTNIDRQFSQLRNLDFERDRRDAFMADGVLLSVEKLKTDGSFKLAVLSVGSNHNDGIEEILEDRGLNVANIKTKVSMDPSMDRKVFFNPKPNPRDGAEWIVTVYDPEIHDGFAFEHRYAVKEGLSPVAVSRPDNQIKNEK